MSAQMGPSKDGPSAQTGSSSVQESIAAALELHYWSRAQQACACGWREWHSGHLAAVAMDAARAAVEALDTYGLADLGRSFGYGWNACHAQICDLLTPEGGHDA